MTPSLPRPRISYLATAIATLIVLCTFSACSRDEPKKEATPSIEPIEGMKYYVGGPLMKADKYGRFRISGFNGEISAPTTRGLLLGSKVLEGNRFEYRTWINGKLISRSTGFIDDDGLYWYDERFTYHFNGNPIARQELHYDDERKVMLSKLEQLDPETGEIIRTHETEIPYTPVDDGEDDWDEDEEDEEDEHGGQQGQPSEQAPAHTGGDAEGSAAWPAPGLHLDS